MADGLTPPPPTACICCTIPLLAFVTSRPTLCGDPALSTIPPIFCWFDVPNLVSKVTS